MKVSNFKDVAPVKAAAGVEKRVVIGPREGAPTFVMRVFDLAPSASTPFHTHDWEHEIFILLGEGTLTMEAGATALKAGDAVFIPSGEKHSFTNKGQATLRFICVVPLRGEDSR